MFYIDLSPRDRLNLRPGVIGAPAPCTSAGTSGCVAPCDRGDLPARLLSDAQRDVVAAREGAEALLPQPGPKCRLSCRLRRRNRSAPSWGHRMPAPTSKSTSHNPADSHLGRLPAGVAAGRAIRPAQGAALPWLLMIGHRRVVDRVRASRPRWQIRRPAHFGGHTHAEVAPCSTSRWARRRPHPRRARALTRTRSRPRLTLLPFRLNESDLSGSRGPASASTPRNGQAPTWTGSCRAPWARRRCRTANRDGGGRRLSEPRSGKASVEVHVVPAVGVVALSAQGAFGVVSGPGAARQKGSATGGQVVGGMDQFEAVQAEDVE